MFLTINQIKNVVTYILIAMLLSNIFFIFVFVLQSGK